MMKKVHIALTTLLLIIYVVGYSQNTYWTQQFGAKASLMGGAVVGGVKDNSAIYYNPAGIGGIDSSNINVSANVYGFEYTDLQNGAGTNLDLHSMRFLLYPQLISGLIRIKKVPRLNIAYTLLTRFRSELKMHVENRMNYDVIATEPGEESYYAAFDYFLSGNTQWGGLGVSYKISPKVSLGLTTFASYAHIEDRRYMNASCDVTQPGYTYSTQYLTSQYNVVDNVTMLWKVGAQFDFNRFKFGIVVTTPSVNIYGESRIGRHLEYFNQDRYLPDTLLIGSRQSFIASDARNGLPTVYKTPLSISAGFEYHFPKSKTTINSSFEYFFPIERYTVAESNEPVYVRPTADYFGATIPNFMKIEIASAGVFNAALGFSQVVKQHFAIYGGVRTDFNNTLDLFGTNENLVNTVNNTFASYIHFSTGLTITKGRSDVTIGLNYGYGFSNIKRQIMNLSDPGVYDATNNTYLLLQGQKDNSVVTNIHSLSLILGYTHYLKSKK
jgi:hypothetical protein